MNDLKVVLKMFCCGLILLIAGLIGFVWCPLVHIFGREESGEYTMVYNVYYNNIPKTYVLHNDLPIRVESHRGTNKVKMFKHGGFFTCDEAVTVISTSAPIELVSYTVKNKEK